MLSADVNFYQNKEGMAVCFSAVVKSSNITACQGAYDPAEGPKELLDFLDRSEITQTYLRSMNPQNTGFRKVSNSFLSSMGIWSRLRGIESKVIPN